MVGRGGIGPPTLALLSIRRLLLAVSEPDEANLDVLTMLDDRPPAGKVFWAYLIPFDSARLYSVSPDPFAFLLQIQLPPLGIPALANMSRHN